ncbi:MAG TPA: hypothetical protein VKW06_12760 [Candidatus Angelobacter sp.]|nr:hypothetical protein [Candidatus Angelobacter sp.]
MGGWTVALCYMWCHSPTDLNNLQVLQTQQQLEQGQRQCVQNQQTIREQEVTLEFAQA